MGYLTASACSHSTVQLLAYMRRNACRKPHASLSADGLLTREVGCNQVNMSAGHSRNSSSGCRQGVDATKPCGQAGVGGKKGSGPGSHQVFHRGQHMQLQQSQQCITTHAAQGGACIIQGLDLFLLLACLGVSSIYQTNFEVRSH